MELYAETPSNVRPNDLLALKLNADLLQQLRSSHLIFKADDSHSFVCTTDKTYKLHGSSCNPTLCVVQESENHDELVLKTSVKTNLTPELCKGWIDWPTVAIYSSGAVTGRDESLEQLKDRSFCSELEFSALWTERAGFEFEGAACIPDDETIYSTSVVINAVIFENQTKDFDEVWDAVDKPENLKPLYFAVFKKFQTSDAKAFPTWIGRYLLSKLEPKTLESKFLSRWKRDLLGYDVDLALLRGYFIIDNSCVVYVDPSSLSKKPIERFKQLFKLYSKWELDQILPFLSDLTDTKERRAAEGYVKKYAKVINTSSSSGRKGEIKKIVRPLFGA